MAAAEATSGGDILGQLTQQYITCDEWTTVEVKQNKLKLVSDLTGHHSLTKIRFAVGDGAVLRVEIRNAPMDFAAGDYSQVGGAHVSAKQHPRLCAKCVLVQWAASRVEA